MQARNQLLALAAKDPLLAGVRANGLDDEPQYRISIDREKASALGAHAVRDQRHDSKCVGLLLRQRLPRPRAAEARVRPGRCPLAHAAPGPRRAGTCATAPGRWCRFSAFAQGNGCTAHRSSSATTACSSVEILGDTGAPPSTGEAMAEMERLAAQLPHGIGYQWTGLSYEEKRPAPRRNCCMGSHSQWCSCVSRRFMRAGRSLRRCCSSSRSELSAPCWRRVSADWITISTSSSACSPRWGFRSRTRF